MAALEIPAAMGFNSKVFDIGHFQQNNPSGDVGFIQTINRSSPAWVAEYTTPGLVGDAYNETRSFLDLLEGSMNTFLAYDPRRPMPYAYRTMSTASTPWGVTPRIIGQDYANSLIALDQMAPGAMVTKGDYISVKVGDIWYLFRAQQTRNADGSGGIGNLLVKPRPQIVSLVATTIRYQKACIEMKMIGDAEETDSVESFPSFRFRAGQFTRRAPI
jgi:hypothetical protein